MALTKLDIANTVFGILAAQNGGAGAKNKINGTGNPTLINDETEGYGPGSTWADIINDEYFVCIDATTSNAVWVKYQKDNLNLTGAVMAFARNTAPEGWLRANGAAVLISTYSDLDAAIYVGNTLNATASFGYRCTNPADPNGSRSATGDYIVLPDLRGVFVRGWADDGSVDIGRVFGSLQTDSIETHSHSANADNGGAHSHTGSTASAGNHSHTASTALSGDHSHTITVDTGGTHSHSGSTSSDSHSHTGTTASDGGHDHDVQLNNDVGNENSNQVRVVSNGSGGGLNGLVRSVDGTPTNFNPLNIVSAGSHTHTFTTSSNSHLHAFTTNSSGAHTHAASSNLTGDHNHAVTIDSDGTHTHSVTIDLGGAHTHTVTVDATGGTETRPTNIALLYCIRYI